MARDLESWNRAYYSGVPGAKLYSSVEEAERETGLAAQPGYVPPSQYKELVQERYSKELGKFVPLDVYNKLEEAKPKIEAKAPEVAAKEVTAKGKLQPIIAKISGYEPTFKGIPSIPGITVAKQAYQPFPITREVVTGFTDVTTQKSIPLQKLTQEQRTQLESEGWRFEKETATLFRPLPTLTPAGYAKQYPREVAKVEEAKKVSPIAERTKEIIGAYQSISKEMQGFLETAREKVPQKIVEAYTGYGRFIGIPEKRLEAVRPGAKITAELGQYLIPGYGELIFFGPPALAILRGPESAKQFIMERPLETALTLVGGGLATRSLVKELEASKTLEAIKNPLIQKLTGTRLNKAMNELQKIEPIIEKQIGLKEIVNSRAYEVKIGEKTIKVIEFSRLKAPLESESFIGAKKTYAFEIGKKGEIKQIAGGLGLTSMDDVAEKTITRLIRVDVPTTILQKTAYALGKSPKAEILTLLEKGTLVDVKIASGKKFYITEGEAKLLQREGYNLKKPLPYFKETELYDRGINPFTEEEWKIAKLISEGRAVISPEFDQAKLSYLAGQRGELLFESFRGVLKTKEKGVGLIKLKDEIKQTEEIMKKTLFPERTTREAKRAIEEEYKKATEEFGKQIFSKKYGLYTQMPEARIPEQVAMEKLGKMIDDMYKREAKEIQKTGQETAKAISKILVQRAVEREAPMGIPAIVGSLGAVSAYEARGIPEIEYGGRIPPGMDVRVGIMRPKEMRDERISISKSVQDMQNEIKVGIKMGISTITITRQDLKLEQDLKQQLRQEEKIKQDLKLVPELKQQLKQELKLKQDLKLRQDLKLKQDLKQMQEIKRIMEPIKTEKIKLLIPIPTLKIGKKKEAGIKAKQGYDVYGKELKTGRFVRLNEYPLEMERAKDIGAYHVSQNLSRTFRITRTSLPAQADYQFMAIPEGFFQATKGRLREYKIRQKRALPTPEQYIQKTMFALSSEGEKKQIQAFRKQAMNVLKF